MIASEPATHGAGGAVGNRNDRLLHDLRQINGERHVLTTQEQTKPYRTGFRFGAGSALAVVRPHSLVEMWQTLRACVEADVIVIVQAANTGLTGGSTPNGSDYDREIVIVSPMMIDGIHVIDEGRQAICLPGATLYALEAALRPYAREPHSVIGSSCIGASVIGGICNNSGGALVRRGPAYTELALYAQLGADGVLRLVNHLGIRLDGEPEAILERVERGDFSPAQIEVSSDRCASDHGYQQRVRDIHSKAPARYNADPGRLFEASGSAGRLALFAVRLDTFPKDEQTAVFYIGTNDPGELTRLRRHILSQFEHLPVAGEYMHRDCFDIAERYGKDTFLAIDRFGAARLPAMFKAKAKVDAWAGRLGLAAGFSDRWMQRLSALFPGHLPKPIKRFRARYEHHLMLKMAGGGIDEAAVHLARSFPSETGDFFRCTLEEGEKAFLHRFAAAGAAVRYRAVHHDSVEEIVALDIALPRNAEEWCETLPPDLTESMLHRLYYGHFFCYVFHQDYILRKGANPVALEHRMWELLDERGAEYPAEHNVGHLYQAKPALREFYRSLDPTNSFNSGVGQTSKRRHWQ